MGLVLRGAPQWITQAHLHSEVAEHFGVLQICQGHVTRGEIPQQDQTGHWGCLLPLDSELEYGIHHDNKCRRLSSLRARGCLMCCLSSASSATAHHVARRAARAILDECTGEQQGGRCPQQLVRVRACIEGGGVVDGVGRNRPGLGKVAVVYHEVAVLHPQGIPIMTLAHRMRKQRSAAGTVMPAGDAGAC